ncbi:hypothetical protein MKW92_011700 [Papaver armeniacum]|nr:hypothetical protein MKW92_011700 [Papaver armeniacum]
MESVVTFRKIESYEDEVDIHETETIVEQDVADKSTSDESESDSDTCDSDSDSDKSDDGNNKRKRKIIDFEVQCSCQRKFSEIADLASVSDEQCKSINEWLDGKIHELVIKQKEVETVKMVEAKNVAPMLDIKDPKRKKRPGRPKSTRIKAKRSRKKRTKTNQSSQKSKKMLRQCKHHNKCKTSNQFFTGVQRGRGVRGGRGSRGGRGTRGAHLNTPHGHYMTLPYIPHAGETYVSHIGGVVHELSSWKLHDLAPGAAYGRY